jgi:hypothetical protein
MPGFSLNGGGNGVTPPAGVGIAAYNNGALVARTMVAGSDWKTTVANGAGDSGNPAVSVQPGDFVLGTPLIINGNLSGDQMITMLSGEYILDRVRLTRASGTPGPCAGGLYTAASKGGITLVASSQVYSTLSSASAVLDLVPVGGPVRLTGPGLYFNFTTLAGAAFTFTAFPVGTAIA